MRGVSYSDKKRGGPHRSDRGKGKIEKMRKRNNSDEEAADGAEWTCRHALKWVGLGREKRSGKKGERIHGAATCLDKVLIGATRVQGNVKLQKKGLRGTKRAHRTGSHSSRK